MHGEGVQLYAARASKHTQRGRSNIRSEGVLTDRGGSNTHSEVAQYAFYSEGVKYAFYTEGVKYAFYTEGAK